MLDTNYLENARRGLNETWTVILKVLFIDRSIYT